MILYHPIKGRVMLQFILYSLPYFSTLLEITSIIVNFKNILIIIAGGVFIQIIDLIEINMKSRLKYLIAIFTYVVYSLYSYNIYLNGDYSDYEYLDYLYYFMIGVSYMQIYITRFLNTRKFDLFIHYIELVGFFLNECFKNTNFMYIRCLLSFIMILSFFPAEIPYMESKNSYELLKFYVKDDVIKAKEIKVVDTEYQFDIENLKKIDFYDFNIWLFLILITENRLYYLLFSVFSMFYDFEIDLIGFVILYLKSIDYNWEYLIILYPSYVNNNPLSRLLINFILLWIYKYLKF
ncbi:hypothetical protein A0H76_365 [Hepatospora eriocheir]|uniref:Uncharacterized protein n=1 Tax=Hepatospora eriocheir TaxID=1081669 RepID=A0A1X0QJ00_9MICR|nr:hypothetical protein A0H76_365 [Hepatospora eriocheir]